jgi:transcriptional regulator with GAF, ATPase, and Fis domain
VTITGETGTGKEIIAKALHSLSPSSRQPFVVCNCGGLAEGLIESELFGHVRGAFTGAISDKVGLFEAAGEGATFLDEIGEIPLSFQAHLLRVLQDGEFRRVGSHRSSRAKCRVIAATNKDLASEVGKGKFREDLYYRLTPLSIKVPPLRERKDDIPLLSRHFLEKFAARTGKAISGISRPAQTFLMNYDWPGNVRELESVIEQAAILSEEPFIGPGHLPERVRVAAAKEHVPGTLDEAIKAHISRALKQCGGNRTRAAGVLGISRRALLRKLDRYSID